MTSADRYWRRRPRRGPWWTEVARQADICTSLIYKWLREEREPQAGAGFAPAILADDAKPLTLTPDAPAIMVELGGARVSIGATAPVALVTATLRALRDDRVPSGVRVWLAAGQTECAGA